MAANHSSSWFQSGSLWDAKTSRYSNRLRDRNLAVRTMSANPTPDHVR
jgi:hypothetical protein